MEAIAKDRLFLLSGPSACGKQTLINKIVAAYPGVFRFTVSMTSRQPREGEKDGVHYHFRDREEFERLIDAGAFLEWAEVHSNLYGTLGSEVVPGVINIADVDVQGAIQIKAKAAAEAGPNLEVVSIFVNTRLLKTLHDRLVGREPNLDRAIVLRRMRTAIVERRNGPKIADHVIFNENGRSDEAVAQLEQILFLIAA
jgi:guanylate kinase